MEISGCCFSCIPLPELVQRQLKHPHLGIPHSIQGQTHRVVHAKKKHKKTVRLHLKRTPQSDRRQFSSFKPIHKRGNQNLPRTQSWRLIKANEVLRPTLKRATRGITSFPNNYRPVRTPPVTYLWFHTTPPPDFCPPASASGPWGLRHTKVARKAGLADTASHQRLRRWKSSSFGISRPEANDSPPRSSHETFGGLWRGGLSLDKPGITQG